MKIYLLLLCFSFLLTGFSDKNDKNQIELAYNEYANASLEKNIDKMIELSSIQTIKYFDETVENAKYLDSLELVKLTPIDKTLILYLRQTLTTAQLSIYTGKELMYYNLEKSLNTNSNEKVKLTNIEVNDSIATCSITVNEKASKSQLEFRKENNLWKFNSIYSFYQSANDNFYDAIKKMNISENEFLKRIVQKMSGKEFDDKLWNQIIEK
jgi:hypothetical protein